MVLLEYVSQQMIVDEKTFICKNSTKAPACCIALQRIPNHLSKSVNYLWKAYLQMQYPFFSKGSYTAQNASQ